MEPRTGTSAWNSDPTRVMAFAIETTTRPVSWGGWTAVATVASHTVASTTMSAVAASVFGAPRDLERVIGPAARDLPGRLRGSGGVPRPSTTVAPAAL